MMNIYCIFEEGTKDMIKHTGGSYKWQELLNPRKK